MKSVALFFNRGLCSINLFALSPDIKFDALKMKLTKQLKAQDYSKTRSIIEKIKSLGVKVSKSFEGKTPLV